jgi:CheY-like chemotaxis protein
MCGEVSLVSQVSAPNCVLLVNCFTDEREMYVEYLRFAQFDPVEVCEPAEAFEIATSLRPLVIVMDVVLPHGLSGFDLIRQLRSDARTRHAAIIVVSGHVFPAHKAKAFAAGCDVFLPKPCLPQDLAAAIHHELTTPRPRAAAG